MIDNIYTFRLHHQDAKKGYIEASIPWNLKTQPQAGDIIDFNLVGVIFKESGCEDDFKEWEGQFMIKARYFNWNIGLDCLIDAYDVTPR